MDVLGEPVLVVEHSVNWPRFLPDHCGEIRTQEIQSGRSRNSTNGKPKRHREHRNTTIFEDLYYDDFRQ